MSVTCGQHVILSYEHVILLYNMTVLTVTADDRDSSTSLYLIHSALSFSTLSPAILSCHDNIQLIHNHHGNLHSDLVT